MNNNQNFNYGNPQPMNNTQYNQNVNSQSISDNFNNSNNMQ